MDAGGWSCSKMVGLIIMSEAEPMIRAPGWIRGRQGSYAQGRLTISERGKS